MSDSALSALRGRGPVMTTVSLPRSRHRLHAMPTNAGYDLVREPGYDWNGRQRGETPFTVLQHSLGGTGRLRWERKSFSVAPGETMLVMIPHDHRYWLEPGEWWEFFWIAMYGQEALRILKTILDAKGPVFRLSPATIETIAGCCLDIVDERAATPGRASAVAYNVVMSLYDDVLGPHADQLDPEQDDAVAAVRDHVRTHLDAGLDVAALARIAGFSRAHFTRIFKEAEGMGPAEYVLMTRMRRAARLLETGDMSVKAISLAVGFADQNYFAKAFRRTFGTSPTEFRTTGMYSVPIRPDAS
ncbi:helix-turn-helix domain-containing protein [Marinivivus vitaminiproducens]|uniref:helix-turn-helix domain-containing protein n=1 Tax=Marinivivus vitaminiproducens TaxID=3035935 RepID=UPI0027A82E56|nr:AraC family transcriptional regulator [Geminicoccaceae bacterium SCSIO 64248]